jgi:acetyl-CoA carboxylase carboxyltransferase component
MFSFEEDTGFERSEKNASDAEGHFSENDVRANVDDGNFLSFKQDYYGSGSVIAGFAKLGGRRAVIIGPRSEEGLRSYPSVVREHAVLRSASRMNIPAILMFSGRWHQNAELYDGPGIRARMDFISVLSNYPKLKICVATDVNCFHSLEIISACDVIIFVKNSKTDSVEQEFVERNAAFIVDSLSAAFELSYKLINLVHPISDESRESVGVPDVPLDPHSPYDMLDAVIRKITDGGEFLEFFESMNSVKTKPNFITGLAKINGETTAILADQPLILGGAADAPNTEKYRVFVQLAGRLNLRILMLSNSSGFIPGTKQERIRIQAIGAEAIDSNILSKVPVVSIVVNQNYGGRQIQAFGKCLRPGIYAMARDTAQMAVIGHAAAFDLLKSKAYNELVGAGKTEEAEAMKKQFIEERSEWALAKNDALSAGAVDEVISDMTNLREIIIDGFEKALKRCLNAFGDDIIK